MEGGATDRSFGLVSALTTIPPLSPRPVIKRARISTVLAVAEGLIRDIQEGRIAQIWQ